MRKPLIIISLVVGVLVAIVVAVPMLLNMENYKPKISSLIEENTGHKVELQGDISLSLFPSLALQANKIRIVETDGEADLATIGRLTLLVELWPLLQQQIKVESLLIEQVKASLKRNAKGKGNWEPHEASSIASKNVAQKESDTKNDPVEEPINPEDIVEEDQQSPFAFLELEEVVVRQAQIDYQDQMLQKSLSLKDVQIIANFKKGKSKVELSGRLRGLEEEHQPFKFSALLSIDPNMSVEAKDVSFKLGKIEGTGNVKYASNKKIQQVEGGLYLNRANVNPYLEWWDAQSKTKKESESTQNSSPSPKIQVQQESVSGQAGNTEHVWSSEPLDIGVLRKHEGHFGLYFDGIEYRNIVLGKGDLYLHLQYGELSAKIKELQALDGNVQGEFKLAAHPSGALDLNVVLALKDVKLQALPTQIRQGAYEPSGTVNLDAKLESRGKSERALISSLRGLVALDMQQVEFAKIEDFLQDQVGDPLVGSAISSYRRSLGKIESVKATWNVDKGVLKNEDLSIRSTPVSFVGKGEIDLPGYQLYYRLVPVRTGDGEQVNIGGIRLPDILVKSRLDNPEIKLDSGNTVRDLIDKGLDEKAVKDIKKDLIEKRREIVDDLKKNLDGNLKNLLEGL
jgi:AsmA protein